MSGTRAAEESFEPDWLSRERTLHEVDVPHKAREQRSKTQEDARTIWSQSVAASCAIGREWAPQSHQHAGDDTDDDALARRGVRPWEAAECFTVEDHCDQCACDSGRQKYQAACRLQDVVQKRSDYERNSN